MEESLFSNDCFILISGTEQVQDWVAVLEVEIYSAVVIADHLCSMWGSPSSLRSRYSAGKSGRKSIRLCGFGNSQRFERPEDVGQPSKIFLSKDYLIRVCHLQGLEVLFRLVLIFSLVVKNKSTSNAFKSSSLLRCCSTNQFHLFLAKIRIFKLSFYMKKQKVRIL